MLLLSRNCHEFSNQVSSLHWRISVLPPNPHYHKRQTLFRWLVSAMTSWHVQAHPLWRRNTVNRRSRSGNHVGQWPFCAMYYSRFVIVTSWTWCESGSWIGPNNSYGAYILPFFSLDDVTEKNDRSERCTRKRSIKLLGVNITNKLSVSDHARHVIASCASTFHASENMSSHYTSDAALSTGQWSFRDYCTPLVPGGVSPQQLTVNA